MKKEKSSKENKEKEIVEEKKLLQPKIDVVFQSLFNKDVNDKIRMYKND